MGVLLVFICVYHIYSIVPGGQKGALDHSEQELQVIVSCWGVDSLSKSLVTQT